MAQNSRPTFKRTSDFRGDDNQYNDLVWTLVKDFGKAAIDPRTLNNLRIDQRDYQLAYNFSFNRPEFSKPASFKGTTEEYNGLVWSAVEAFGKAATDGRTLNALGVGQGDYEKAYKFRFPQP